MYYIFLACVCKMHKMHKMKESVTDVNWIYFPPDILLIIQIRNQ